MKKLIALLIALLCIFSLTVNSFAAEDNSILDQKDQNTITVSFKAGTGVYSVNGKTVKAEASATVSGKVFVPVKVITDALNATLTVDTKTKTATINYNGVVIKLTEKKATAVIAGKTQKIDAAPYIKNSTFMASITFLADTLGADVKNSNGKVSFIKEIANPNSIVDFSSLVKKSTKSKVGDSYYGWSMNMPDDLRLDYRNFNGSENLFVAQDESYILGISLGDKKSETSLDTITNNTLQYIKEKYTLIDYTNGTTGGVNFVEFIYKDDKYAVQQRFYIVDQRLYIISLFTNKGEAYDDEKYMDLIESFSFTFNKNGSTEDLSDVTSSGYRKYQDTRLKWSINMLPYFEEYKDEKIQNKIAFYGKEDEYLSVEVYSLEKGDTVDSIIQKYMDIDLKEFNPAYLTVSVPVNITVNGIQGKKYESVLKLTKNKIYCSIMVFTDKNYKYVITSEAPESVYTDANKKKMFEGMFNSFSFKALDAKVIGKLLDPKKVSLDGKTRPITGDGYSFDLPVSWIYDDENSEGSYQSYYFGTASVAINYITDVSLSDVVSYYDSKYAKLAGDKFKLESKQSINDKDTYCYKYSMISVNDYGTEFKTELYIIQKGNKVYLVDLSINNMYYSTKYAEIFNNIWKSLKFS